VPKIEFAELEERLWQRLGDPSELALVRRFRDEREIQRFGIYSGTTAQGRVATIETVAEKRAVSTVAGSE
jgi:hypothetical protein